MASISTGFRLLAISSAVLVAVLVFSLNSVTYGQIGTPCTMSMISSFTPCINFVTGSSNNGSTPTASCCSTLRSFLSTNMDCACLLITANVPIPLPIVQSLALSLPSACNMGGVPVQCKGSGSPLPAPGPVVFGAMAPSPADPSLEHADSPLSAGASKAVAVVTDERRTDIAPSEAPTEAEAQAPTATPGIRPVLTPPLVSSSSNRRYDSLMSSLIVLFIGIVISMINQRTFF